MRKKAIVDPWVDDSAYRIWMEGLEKRDPEGNIINEGTLKNMKHGSRIWMGFVKIDPSEQARMRGEQLQSKDPTERNYWESKLEDFKKHCCTLKSETLIWKRSPQDIYRSDS